MLPSPASLALCVRVCDRFCDNSQRPALILAANQKDTITLQVRRSPAPLAERSHVCTWPCSAGQDLNL